MGHDGPGECGSSDMAEHRLEERRCRSLRTQRGLFGPGTWGDPRVRFEYGQSECEWGRSCDRASHWRERSPRPGHANLRDDSPGREARYRRTLPGWRQRSRHGCGALTNYAGILARQPGEAWGGTQFQFTPAAGRVTVNTAPPPGELAASMLPLCSFITDLQMLKPS